MLPNEIPLQFVNQVNFTGTLRKDAFRASGNIVLARFLSVGCLLMCQLFFWWFLLVILLFNVSDMSGWDVHNGALVVLFFAGKRTTVKVVWLVWLVNCKFGQKFSPLNWRMARPMYQLAIVRCVSFCFSFEKNALRVKAELSVVYPRAVSDELACHLTLLVLSSRCTPCILRGTDGGCMYCIF